MDRRLLIFLVISIISLQSPGAIAQRRDAWEYNEQLYRLYIQEQAKAQAEQEVEQETEQEQEQEQERRERQQQQDPYVVQMQRNLAKYGYNPGPIDGIYGPATEMALQAFCRDLRITTDDCARIAGSRPSDIEAYRQTLSATQQAPQTQQAQPRVQNAPIHDAAGSITPVLLFIAAVFIGICIVTKHTDQQGAQQKAQGSHGKEQARQNTEDAKRKYAKEQARKHAEQARRKAEAEQARRKVAEEARRNAANRQIQICFDTFELPRTASFDDVKKKYKIMIKLFHPDRHSADNGVKEYADGKAKELNNAFNTLKKEHFRVK
jgi:peptidoglycan hydrolase-like protein with peptidoglycan-binding domain